MTPREKAVELLEDLDVANWEKLDHEEVAEAVQSRLRERLRDIRDGAYDKDREAGLSVLADLEIPFAIKRLQGAKLEIERALDELDNAGE